MSSQLNTDKAEFTPAYDKFPAELVGEGRYEFHANYRHLFFKDGYIIAPTSDNTRILTIIDARTYEFVNALSRTHGHNLGGLNSYWGVLDEETNVLYLGLRRVATTEAPDKTPLGAIVAVDLSNISEPVYLGEYVWVYDASADPDSLELALVTSIDLFTSGERKFLAVAGNSSSAGGAPDVGQAGFCVVDVTDPTQMFVTDYHAQREDVQIRPHSVQVINDRLAVTANYTSLTKRIQTWDLSEPDNASMLGYTAPQAREGFMWGLAKYPGNENLVGFASCATRPSVDAGTAYLGMVMADISNPYNIKVISEARVPEGKVDRRAVADVPPTFMYFCQKGEKIWGLLPGGEHALHVFDCTDPNNVIFSHNAELSGDYGLIMSRSCLVYEMDGEQIVAIGDGPGQPSSITGTKGITFAKIQWEAVDFIEPQFDKIVYIDPTQPEDGDGTSKLSPRNTWAGVVQADESAAYLQKAGTTYNVTHQMVPDELIASEDAPVYFGAYGVGDKPVLKAEGSNYPVSLYKCNIQGQGACTIENFVIDSTNIDGVRIRIANPEVDSLEGVVISKCDFITRITSSTGIHSSILFYQDGKDFRHCVVKDCTFTSDKQVPEAEGHFIRIYQTAAREVTNFLIARNSFMGIDTWAIRIFASRDASNPDLGAWRPVGMRVVDNTFTDCVLPISFHTGMKSTDEYKSEITGNLFLNSGSWEKAHINALQASYLDDVEIAYNIFENVYTSEPDGVAIIMDWAHSDERYLCTNCLIHHNVISGCNSARAVSRDYGSAAISLYRAKDCLVYSNWIFDCNSGIGVSGDGRNPSSGNRVFNNTIMRCIKGIRCAESTDGTAFENNLVMFSEEGMLLSMPAASPVVARNNLLYNNTTNLRQTNPGSAHELDNIEAENNIVVKFPYDREKGFILQDESPALLAGADLPVDGRIDTRTFGLNNAPVSNPPSIGAWQPE